LHVLFYYDIVITTKNKTTKMSTTNLLVYFVETLLNKMLSYRRETALQGAL